MANRLVEVVLKESKAKGTTRLILMILAHRADNDGLTWQSANHLADQAGISRERVFFHLKKLEDIGEIQRFTKGGKFGNNAYRLRITDSNETITENSNGTVTDEKGNSNETITENSNETITVTVTEPLLKKPREKPNEKPIVNYKTLRLTKTPQSKERTLEKFEEWFEDHFWAIYPAHKLKSKTFAKRRLKAQIEAQEKPGKAMKQITENLKRWKQIESWNREGGRFIPNVVSFIEDGKIFLDPPEFEKKQKTKSPGDHNADYKTTSPLELTGNPAEDLARLERLKAEGKKVPKWKIEALRETLNNQETA